MAHEAAGAAPDLLLVVGRIRHDVAMARRLVSSWKQGAPRPRVTAVVATPIDQFRRALGKDAEGFVGPSQWEPPPADSAVTPPLDCDGPLDYFGPTPARALASLERAAATAGVPVDYPMAQAYAAGLVAQRCLELANSTSPERLWEAATNADFRTFFGRFKIDRETGRQVGRSTYIVQRQRGCKVVVWPPEHAQGTLAIS